MSTPQMRILSSPCNNLFLILISTKELRTNEELEGHVDSSAKEEEGGKERTIQTTLESRAISQITEATIGQNWLEMSLSW